MTAGPSGALATLRRIAHPIVAVLAAAGLNLALQVKSQGFADPDGYYHIRWSRLLGDGLSHGSLPDFTWLPLTILNERDYADHHFLFHVLQAPFAWEADILTGAKVSAVLFATLAYLGCYALVVRAQPRYRLAWLVLLLGSSLLVLARMSLPRAPAVMIALLALTIWLLFTERYAWLAVAAFVTVWTYSLFPLIGVFAVVWAALVSVERKRVEWRPVGAAAAGTLAGLVVNPYFPQNVYLFLAHLTKALPSGPEVLGNEWAPMSLRALFVFNGVALAAQVVATAVWLVRRRSSDAETHFMGIVSLLLFALALKSVRFTEYWAPIAVVFLAVAARPAVAAWHADHTRSRRARIAVLAGAGVLCAAIAAHTVLFVAWTDTSAIRSSHPEVYEGPAAWLRENTPPGSLVYNVEWEDFPPLFCFDTHNAYVAGLDPTYLSYEHPELGRLYGDIEEGQVPSPGAVIRDRFGARYVFASATSAAFLQQVRLDPSMRVVYRSPHAIVFAIADAPPR